MQDCDDPERLPSFRFSILTMPLVEARDALNQSIYEICGKRTARIGSFYKDLCEAVLFTLMFAPLLFSWGGRFDAAENVIDRVSSCIPSQLRAFTRVL